MTRLFILAVGFIAFWNAQHADFTGDDFYRIIGAKDYLAQGLRSVLSHSLSDRPFLMFTIWLNYVAGGLNPWGYKLVNIALHAGVGLALFSLIRALCETHGRRFSFWPAAVVCALFIAHPVHNSVINQVIQRGVILAALFSVLAMREFVVYTRVQKAETALRCLLFLMIAILSKQNAIVAPICMTFYAVLFARRLSVAKLLAGGWVLSLIPVAFYLAGENIQYSALTPLHYLIVQTRVTFIYFKLLFVPWPLHYVYDIDTSPEISANLTWLGILAHIGILSVLAWVLTQRDRLAGFAALCIYLAFIPESSVFPIVHLIFEHRTYFPFLFFALTLYLVIEHIFKNTRVAGAALSVLIIPMTIADWRRTEVISTRLKWIEDTISHSTSHSGVNLFALQTYIDTGMLSQGHALSLKLHEAQPAIIEYGIYKTIFEFSDLSAEEKRQAIDHITRALTTSDIAIESASRSRFTGFVVNALEKLAPAESAIKSEFLLRRQMSYFVRSPGEFGRWIAEYRSIAERLKALYESKVAKGRLSEDDELRYLTILLTEEFYFSRRRDGLDHMLAEFAERYPKNARIRELIIWRSRTRL